MSLIGWFPLNQNLNNYGASTLNAATVQTGVAIATDGKLGRCYTNTGTTGPASTSFTLSSYEFTLAGWVRINAKMSNWARAFGMASSNSYIGMCCENSNGTTLGFHYYKTIDGTNTSIVDGYPATVEVGKWVHYVFAFDGTKYYIYQNGSLLYSGNANRSNIKAEMTTLYLFGGNANGYSKCSLNDIRIYNHCLTKKEVKDISRGLYLHYPLNFNGRPIHNLAKSTNTSTMYAYFAYGEQTGGSTQSAVTIDGIPCAKITRNDTAHSGWSYLRYGKIDINSITTSTTYTISMDVRASGDGSILMGGFRNTDGTNNMCTSNANIQPNFTANKWCHLVYRTTTLDSFSGITVSSQVVYMWCSFLEGVNTSIIMKNFKVEIGDRNTPWSPHNGEDDYTRMGYNMSTTIDVSGCQYNGTNAGIGYTLGSSDTPRYSSCTYFQNGANDKITAPIYTCSDAITMSVWVRSKNGTAGTGGYHMPLNIDDHVYEFSIGSNGYFRNGFVVNDTRVVDTTPGPDVISDKKWHMLTATFDGSNIKRYVDGVLVQTQAASGALSGGSHILYVGTYGTSTTYASKELYESDIRIYATALSAEDIKELYSTAMSIDNKGDAFAYEYTEV